MPGGRGRWRARGHLHGRVRRRRELSRGGDRLRRQRRLLREAVGSPPPERAPGCQAGAATECSGGARRSRSDGFCCGAPGRSGLRLGHGLLPPLPLRRALRPGTQGGRRLPRGPAGSGLRRHRGSHWRSTRGVFCLADAVQRKAMALLLPLRRSGRLLRFSRIVPGRRVGARVARRQFRGEPSLLASSCGADGRQDPGLLGAC
mmetsp:Transcript_34239/g.102281  ORF Transcript_34239/g.102281 Transcript_34239/m.102281 type:complete len:203 (+) Transcript_34239:873-1481(+)